MKRKLVLLATGLGLMLKMSSQTVNWGNTNNYNSLYTGQQGAVLYTGGFQSANAPEGGSKANYFNVWHQNFLEPQVASSLAISSDNNLYSRIYTYGTWSTWNKYWHSGNLVNPIFTKHEYINTSNAADDLHNEATFSYVGGTPYYGALLSFGGLNGNYDCQINTHYMTGNNIAWRQKNGDNGTWSGWKEFYHAGNLNKSDVDFTANNVNISGSLTFGNWLLYKTAWPGSGGITYVGGDITFGICSTSGQTSLQIDGAFIQAEGEKTNYYAGPSNFSNAVSFPGAGVWNTSGNVGIGTNDPGTYKLNVWGSVRAHAVVVNTTGADFVFEPTYQLRPLSEVETFIKAHKHLPEIAPANDMQTNGVSMGEMQAKLLQKVEELTLYSIEQSKQLQEQRRSNANLESKLADQAKQNEELKQEVEQLKLLITQKLK